MTICFQLTPQNNIMHTPARAVLLLITIIYHGFTFRMIYMARILKVEGIGKTYSEKLVSRVITTRARRVLGDLFVG
jgi:hypothetical protein